MLATPPRLALPSHHTPAVGIATRSPKGRNGIYRMQLCREGFVTSGFTEGCSGCQAAISGIPMHDYSEACPPRTEEAGELIDSDCPTIPRCWAVLHATDGVGSAGPSGYPCQNERRTLAGSRDQEGTSFTGNPTHGSSQNMGRTRALASGAGTGYPQSGNQPSTL